jgi:hypothetical protein
MVHISIKWLTFVNTVMKLAVPEKAVDFLTIWKTINFWRRILLSWVNCLQIIVMVVMVVLSWRHYNFPQNMKEILTFIGHTVL